MAVTSQNVAGYSLRRTNERVNQQQQLTAKSSPSDSAPNRKRASPGSSKSGRVKRIRKLNSTGASDDDEDERNAHAAVTETLRIFNKNYLHFVQEEEKRCARPEKCAKTSKSKAEEKRCARQGKGAKKSKSKKKKAAKDGAKRPSMRPDLKAYSEMKNSNSVLYPEKRIGHLPGIEVGRQFFSRAEMAALGFHHHWLFGIDSISSKESMQKMGLNYPLPLTVSIVLSGQYEDDVDNFDEIIYTGQGGHDLCGKKGQIKDQVMDRGNLGLKNCMDHSVPVRVTRGRKCQNSYVGKVYTYDGLYKVVSFQAEKGLSGFTVFKYQLKRLQGQPPLTKNAQVQFVGGSTPKSPSQLRGLVYEDITGGLEGIPIPVTNLVEDPPISPPSFTYINDLKFSENIKIRATAPGGCNCAGGTCMNSRSCACAKLNGGDFPYVQRDGGRLVEPKSVVFECGPKCGCGPQCVNRISQRGPKYRLEVYRTPKKGWGVRSWDYIPSGAPVCEYIGLVKRTEDLDPAADNSYVFDIDCLQTMKGLDGRESRLGDVSLPSHLRTVGEEVSESVQFCIDAGKIGNVARFINHSCQPNLFVQCILSNHHDIRLARVILVAADNIPPHKELTYDYGYALDSVIGPDGIIQQMPCFCGARGCRKRLY